MMVIGMRKLMMNMIVNAMKRMAVMMMMMINVLIMIMSKVMNGI